MGQKIFIDFVVVGGNEGVSIWVNDFFLSKNLPNIEDSYPCLKKIKIKKDNTVLTAVKITS